MAGVASTQAERDRVKRAALGIFRACEQGKASRKQMLETVIFDRATMQGARKEPWGGASAQLQVSILDTNGVEVLAGQRRVPD